MASISDNQHPHFPARTVMKIITLMPESIIDQQNRLESVFHKLLLAPKEWKNKSSREKKYVSFTTTVYIQNREQLQNLYSSIEALPEVKQIL